MSYSTLTRRTTLRSKPKPWVKPERRPAVANTLPLPRATMAARLDGAAPIPVCKDAPHYSEAWRRAVASLPCVRCGREGQTQAAHRNEGKAKGAKTDDALTAALCVACHAEIDQGKDMTRDERRREMDRAILKTLVCLFRAGKVRVA